MRATTTSGARVTLAGVVRGEFIKLRGLRSTWWIVSLAVAVPILVIAVFALNTPPAGLSAFDDANAVLGAVTSSIFETLVLFVLFGALVGTTEYDTRTMTTTIAAVPRRWPVVVAKTIVVAAVTFGLSVIVLLLGFVVATAIVPTQEPIGLGAGGMLRALVGTALFQVSAALIALYLGLILRSSIGAIAGTFGFLYVLPGAINLVPLTPFTTFASTFPGPASDSVTTLIATGNLPYGPAMIAIVLWTAVWLGAAVWTTQRKDV